jgi:hypothetical protein
MPCVPHTWPTSDAAPSYFAWLPDSHRPCARVEARPSINLGTLAYHSHDHSAEM